MSSCSRVIRILQNGAIVRSPIRSNCRRLASCCRCRKSAATPGWNNRGRLPLSLVEGPSPLNSIAMKARVTVTLKSGVLDPQGKAIEGALRSLGVGGIASVRQGKVFDIEIEGADRAGAEAALKNAAEKLLANTVIENYRVEVLP